MAGKRNIIAGINLLEIWQMSQSAHFCDYNSQQNGGESYLTTIFAWSRFQILCRVYI